MATVTPWPWSWPHSWTTTGTQAPATIAINGTDVDILSGSLSIIDAVETRSTASFTVRDTAGSAEYLQGQPVEIKRLDGTIIFGGVIDNCTEERVGTGDILLHHVMCVDWHYLADKRVIAESFTDKTAGYVVNYIINNSETLYSFPK